MAERKTQETGLAVEAFLASVVDPRKQADARALSAVLAEVTGETPVMWGPSIVGFGRQTQTLANGRTQPWLRVGFSPRKAALVLYLPSAFPGRTELLGRLGKHTTGVGCVNVERMADIDEGVLRELVRAALGSRDA